MNTINTTLATNQYLNIKGTQQKENLLKKQNIQASKTNFNQQNTDMAKEIFKINITHDSKKTPIFEQLNNRIDTYDNIIQRDTKEAQKTRQIVNIVA